ncbi:tRNA(m5U54)methyltransferase [Orbilia oligospora]|nr:tRNA(m5U54)methyltransferase [Orbilia oligospora]KAF3240010.1 tRNA(m5U54)methyltransferase [Orbilia oligospora]KAF3269389.1 tRNA(m5U54)methyltransferase [Orbilia oligospora]KAF3277201.1 tRNA(m5U54)methyltransferase [Orbilia oligospora]
MKKNIGGALRVSYSYLPRLWDTSCSAYRPLRAVTSRKMSGTKRPGDGLGPKAGEKRWKRKKIASEIGSSFRSTGSHEEVLLQDVKLLLGEAHEPGTAPEQFSQVELSISMLGSTGDGLSISHDGTRVYVVPFAVPGDTVVVKVVKNFPSYSMTDLIEVIKPSKNRDDDLVFCRYFGRCSGCQFQMLSGDYQLQHKQKVIAKAMQNFSNLDPSLIPPIGGVMPSPLLRGYRTKLTPHFDGPRRGGFKEGAPIPDIGFQLKGRSFVLDIEDCPIGTDAVRDGFKSQRTFVKENLHTFKRGATLLLRETTERTFSPETIDGREAIRSYRDIKTCITDSKALVTEWIGKAKFISPAGSFFQNNNSILEKFTTFVQEQLVIPKLAGQDHSESYLIDAYCGSGLFSICCGHGFNGIIGVDISSQSIESARKNATENGIHNARFITGNAEAIFANIDFPPELTSMVIDPPRKGCDELFLSQLLKLGPKRLVYISCNVHTMARDIGWIVQQGLGKDYRIDKIGGFDFFPQTHHVEGYAVLSKNS